MTLTLFQVSVPPFIQGLRILSQLLKMGQEYAATGKVTEDKLVQAKLVEDMKPLTYQIQRISDTAKGLAVRVGNADPVPMADTETNFAEMESRIQATIAVLQSVKESDMKADDDEVIFGERKLAAKDYVVGYAVPNFYFHLVTSYGLLRMEGVPVGKMDYLKLH